MILVRYRSRYIVRFQLFISSAPARNRVLDALRRACEERGLQCIQAADSRPNFIWSTSPKLPLDAACSCNDAIVFNHLPGTFCLEDKFLLASFASKACNVESVPLHNKAEFASWCDSKTGDRPKFYVLKDARANGGTGIWMFQHPSADKQYMKILDQIGPNSSSYVVQDYIENPALWQGRKFHFRIGAVKCADGKAYLHRVAFLHPANRLYSTASLEPTVHLTNLCVNYADKDNGSFIGEVIEDLLIERPELFKKCLEIFGQVCDSLQFAFQTQRNGTDFEYIGLDFLASDDGSVHLLEANCPPAMVSPTKFVRAEALHDLLLYDTMSAFVVGNLAPVKHIRLGGFIEAPRARESTENHLTIVPTWAEAQSRGLLAKLVGLKKAAKKTI